MSTARWHSWLVFGPAVVLMLSISVAYAGPKTGTAGKVIDGDTLWVCDKDKCRKIRLCGVDAPERGQKGWRASRDALAAIVRDKTIRCVAVGEGTPCDGRSKRKSRDRIVAQCFVGDLDISGEMVRKGFACDWVRFSNGHYSKAGGKRCPK